MQIRSKVKNIFYILQSFCSHICRGETYFYNTLSPLTKFLFSGLQFNWSQLRVLNSNKDFKIKNIFISQVVVKKFFYLKMYFRVSLSESVHFGFR